jgi:uncharacterized lipoprotein YmbA
VNARLQLSALLLLIVWLAGCAGQQAPRKTRYVLHATRERPATPLEVGNLRIGRVPVDPRFERKGFVYRTGEDVYESDFYREFYSPPGVLVRQMMAEWMNASEIFSAVLGSADSGQTHWVLEARVETLYIDLRLVGAPKSVIEIEFSMVDSASPELDSVFRRSYSAALTVPDMKPESFVAGWSEGISEILTSLESDLRAAFAEKDAGPSA